MHRRFIVEWAQFRAVAGTDEATMLQASRAMQLEFDFVVLGPVKDKQAIGWQRFAEIAAGASIPIYAIGGLTRADLEDAWRAGAHGVAMIRGAWS